MTVVSYKPREVENQFKIVRMPTKVRQAGYIGDLAILDTKNNIAYPVNANNMCLLMNGHTNLTGIQL